MPARDPHQGLRAGRVLVRRRWKPATRESNRLLVRNHILPFFGEMRVADITRAHVRRWFDGLSERPGSARSRCQARIA